MDEKYVKALEAVIKQMLTPLKNIPFNVVIEAICQHKIIPFDSQDPKDVVTLKKLGSVAKRAGADVNVKGILRLRANEVGNDIEPYVMKALKSIGYKADMPLTTSGSKKAAGYPDLKFVDEFNRTNYLECKTYNIDNIDTTQRSFYLSPSDEFKVTSDAHHFVISFEIYVAGRRSSKNVYKCKSWKILSIHNLLVDVKYEFNSDNRRLYSQELILAEGTL